MQKVCLLRFGACLRRVRHACIACFTGVFLALVFKIRMLREPTILSRMSGLIQGIKLLSGFQTTVENPMRRLFLRPITTGTNSAMNQSEFLEISCNLLNAREESLLQVAIGFGFASHWLKNWRQGF